MINTDVLVIGAGAAGLFCARVAGLRGRTVTVLDHSNKVGKKILMSGGGRCNFTNYHVRPECFISHNPHFCKSALSRFTPADFIELVERYRIPYHEKTLGQLFCDDKAKDIVNLLTTECELAGVSIKLHCTIHNIRKVESGFRVKTSLGEYHCQSLVIATGGLSIPTMGATAFGYQVAEQFGLAVYPTRAGLVPFTLHEHDKARFAPLAGVATPIDVASRTQRFAESMLFTHRGLSGPAMLQISSYWQPGEDIRINFLPNRQLAKMLNEPEKTVKTLLSQHLPKRLVTTLLPEALQTLAVKSLTPKQLQSLQTLLHDFTIKPNATEGYRTAEVTLGGVDCNQLCSKTMAAREVAGLYFIGEVVDVTGWLGGYNFQWAWASGHAAGLVC